MGARARANPQCQPAERPRRECTPQNGDTCHSRDLGGSPAGGSRNSHVKPSRIHSASAGDAPAAPHITDGSCSYKHGGRAFEASESAKWPPCCEYKKRRGSCSINI